MNGFIIIMKLKQHNMKSKLISSKSIWAGMLFLLCNSVLAQQEPMYTQYMFNTQNINPAYAGSWQTLGFMVLSRYQWTGINDAPSTQTFSLQTPFKNENVAIGLNVLNDQYGLEKRFSLFGDYSYRLRAGIKTDLRLGLKIGFTNYSNNLSAYNLVSGNDPRFQGEIDTKLMPNFGVGAFFSNPKYYFGFSVPKLINNEFKNNYNNFSTQAEIRHLYLIAGYVFNFSENIKFKPTLLTKVTANSPVQADFSANFLFKEKIWLGAMYRSGDAVGFLAQWIFNNKLRIGYAVDFSTSKLGNYNHGTHEVMVSYEINYLKNIFTSPRYF